MKDQESTTKESKWKALCLSHVGTKKKEESDAQPKAYKKKPSRGRQTWQKIMYASIAGKIIYPGFVRWTLQTRMTSSS